MTFVKIERPAERIALVRFDRGDKANAFSRALMKELLAAALTLATEIDISAVILTGRDDVFTLGMDLKEASNSEKKDKSGEGNGLAARRQGLKLGGVLCDAWQALDCLTIAAIEGWAVGGGAALAASCDFRVAGKSAKLYAPEVERGMNMSWGAVPRFVALCGIANTKRFVSLCEKWDSAQAKAYGLVDEIAPDGKALEAAMEIAQRAAALPPNGVKMTKQDINAYGLALANLASRSDRDNFALSQTSQDFSEGVQSFIEKRKPKWTGK